MLMRWFRSMASPLESNPATVNLESKLDFLTALPTLPDTTVRAMALANDPRSSLADFAALIRRDGAVATAVLKMANSPLYRVGRAVDNLHAAVLRLGMKGCSNIITTIGMRGMFKQVDPAHHRRCEVLWRHGFFTACLSTLINQNLSLGYQGEEFTAGLLHDMGRILFVLLAPEQSVLADRLDFEENEGILQAEQRLLGIDHCRLGYRFGEKNHFPRSIQSCLLLHHAADPVEADLDYRLVQVVSAADHLANHVHRTHSVRDYPLHANKALFNLLTGRPGTDLEEFAGKLPGLVVRAMKVTRSILKSTASKEPQGCPA